MKKPVHHENCVAVQSLFTERRNDSQDPGSEAQEAISSRRQRTPTAKASKDWLSETDRADWEAMRDVRIPQFWLCCDVTVLNALIAGVIPDELRETARRCVASAKKS